MKKENVKAKAKEFWEVFKPEILITAGVATVGVGCLITKKAYQAGFVHGAVVGTMMFGEWAEKQIPGSDLLKLYEKWSEEHRTDALNLGMKYVNII